MAAVAALTVFTYAARSWRWGFLLAPLGRVRFADLYSATMVGFMTGLVVPRAGEIVRPYLIARRYPIATSAGFASIVLERLMDLVAALFLLFAYFYLLPRPAMEIRGPVFEKVRAGGALAGVASLGVLVVLLLWDRYPRAVMRVVDRVLRVGPTRLAAALSRMAHSFGEGLAVLRASPLHLLAIFGQSIVLWMLLALGVHWNNRAFGLDLPYHSAFLILAALVVGVAVPTPGTVGGFHAAYKYALTGVYGVQEETAGAAAIAGHLLTNLPVLVLGLAFLGREGLTFGKVADMGDAR
jgi:uncharacterized protein (TIRG00374 family)